jgi:CheY-like chemotaxis protein
MFKKLGYHIDLAGNGIQAVEMATKNIYDLIFMDVQMPEMDGLTATKELKKIIPPNQFPIIIAMTAYAMEGDKEKCIEAGMVDYLPKPYMSEDIAGMIKKHKKALESNHNRQANITSAPSNESAGDLIDSKMIERLHEMSDGDESFFVSLVQMFIKQSDQSVEEIIAFVNAGEIQKAASAAHKLKGSALNLGANKLADICKHIENAGREHDLQSMKEGIADFQPIYEASREALRELAHLK